MAILLDEFRNWPFSEEVKKLPQKLITNKSLLTFDKNGKNNSKILILKYYLFFTKIQSSPYSFPVSYKIKFLHTNELSYIHQKEV
jgi:hypothetical protein